MDEGTEEFEPSTIAFTSFDVGNPTTNVIPAKAHAAFNVRFNDLHMPDTLMAKIEGVGKEIVAAMGGEIEFTNDVSGVAFVTRPGPYTDLLSGAVQRATRRGAGIFRRRRNFRMRALSKIIAPSSSSVFRGKPCTKSTNVFPSPKSIFLVDIYASVLRAYFESRAE